MADHFFIIRQSDDGRIFAISRSPAPTTLVLVLDLIWTLRYGPLRTATERSAE